MGKAAAAEFVRRGHAVTVVVRDSNASREACREIAAAGGGTVQAVYADLSSLRSVRDAASEIARLVPKIHVLINNAGVFRRTESLTVDGHETTLAVNYLAPFLLTTALLPNLTAGRARVVNVSSAMYTRGRPSVLPDHRRKRFSSAAYADSKCMLNCFTRELAQRHPELCVLALHPCVGATSIFRDYPRIVTGLLGRLFAPAEECGDNLVYLATASELTLMSGEYFRKRRHVAGIPMEMDRGLRARLWDATASLVAL